MSETLLSPEVALISLSTIVFGVIAHIILSGRQGELTLSDELRARFGNAAVDDSQKRRMRAKGRGI